jgi:TRAP transporter TAXI family solute receptor
MRRIWLTTIAGTLAIAAMIAFGLFYASRPTILRIAVGPLKGDDLRLVGAIAGQLGRDRASIRLRLVEKEGPAEAAAALDKGEADLAVVRRDITMSATGQVVVLVRTNVVAILAPMSTGAKRIGDLVGRNVGVVGRSDRTAHVLEAVLAQYEISPQDVHTVAVDPDYIAQMFREKRIDILFIAGPATGKDMSDAVAAATQDGKPPMFIPISEADALAARRPVYESTEIVAGAFGGNPPRPAESVDTIGFSYYLVARNTLSDQLVGDFAKMLLSARNAILSEFPSARLIKAPETDKDSAVSVHPGAAAYYDGEQKTFFDRYSDYLYLGVMLISILGSTAAALASRARAGARQERYAVLTRLTELMTEARNALTLDRLQAVEDEVERILVDTLQHIEAERPDETWLRGFSLALEQVRHVIAERRAALATQVPLVPQSA